MKTLQKFLSIVLVVLISSAANAQNRTEDVVYLKDGSIYRGVLVEQVPNVSLKVQIMGGSVVAIQMEEILKITKETPFSEHISTHPVVKEKPQAVERVKTPFEPRTKGYFFQGQLLIEALQGGMRFVNGYKFGRFGHLGIGVGFDAFGGSVLNQPVNGLNPTDLAGVYLPLYLYYAGDILPTRVTPFYVIEAGYAHPLRANNGSFGMMENDGFGGGNSYEIDGGGPMGTVGLGVRFNTKRRINFSLLLNLGMKNVRYSQYYYLYDSLNGVYDQYGTTGLRATLITGGLRFGIGF